jgi:hypothetical protein
MMSRCRTCGQDLPERHGRPWNPFELKRLRKEARYARLYGYDCDVFLRNYAWRAGRTVTAVYLKARELGLVTGDPPAGCM